MRSIIKLPHSTNQMKINVLRDLILQSKGRIFTVIFKKADGSLRKMNCRTGVKKYLVDPFKLGTELEKYSRFTGRITVYDVQEKGYRSFYLDSIKELNICGFRLVNYWD